MFSQGWMWVLGVAAALGLLSQRPLFFAAALLALATSLVVVAWGRVAFRGVVFVRRIKPDRVFPGDVVTLSLAVENRKRLPLPWLRLEEQVPEEAAFARGKVEAHYLPRRARLVSAFQVGWYERVTHHYQVTLARRGSYAFGPCQVTTGDLFGFEKVHRDDPGTAELLVFPPVVPLEQLGLPPGLPLGGVRSRNALEVDPAAIAGTRAYDPRDDFRDVHWYATARLGDLQTKVYEPMMDQSVAVFLNAATMDPAWAGQYPAWLETAVTTAASVLHDCSEGRIPIGLYSNGHVQGQGSTLRLPVGAPASVFAASLEGLARLLAPPVVAFDALLLQEAPRLPAGATVLVVTAVVSEGLRQVLAEVSATRAVVALLVGEASVPAFPGVSVHRVTWEGGRDDAVQVVAL